MREDLFALLATDRLGDLCEARNGAPQENVILPNFLFPGSFNLRFATDLLDPVSIDGHQAALATGDLLEADCQLGVPETIIGKLGAGRLREIVAGEGHGGGIIAGSPPAARPQMAGGKFQMADGKLKIANSRLKIGT